MQPPNCSTYRAASLLFPVLPKPRTYEAAHNAAANAIRVLRSFPILIIFGGRDYNRDFHVARLFLRGARRGRKQADEKALALFQIEYEVACRPEGVPFRNKFRFQQQIRFDTEKELV
jgi:hypothetical protein